MKNIILIILGSSFLLILSLFAFSMFGKSNSPKIITYTKTEVQRPKVQLIDTYSDMGNIKVKDTITKDFTVKNIGDKPLDLSGINSNCGCTSARIIYEGTESKEYGMHRVSTDVIEVAPGKQAVIRVIYRPYTMPVYGVVSREVYIDTNDPDQPKIVLRIKANVN